MTLTGDQRSLKSGLKSEALEMNRDAKELSSGRMWNIPLCGGMVEYWNDGGMEYWENSRQRVISMEVRMMSKIHKRFVQYLFMLFIAVSGFAAGCMVPGGPGMMRQPFGQGERNTFITQDLEKLWNERTIRLLPAFEGAGGPGGMRRSFPLTASATLMDSVLADYGLEEFAKLAGMNDSERILYKTTYKEVNKIDENIFVWLELKTSYSKDLLKIDNWSIFFEDDI